MSYNKSKIVFYIYDILKNFSDEEHSITLVEIAKKLEEKNIKCNRKTISNNINLLKSVGVEIEKASKGLFLSNRTFEESELVFLIDSIFSNPVIPYNYAKDLIDKLLKDRSEFEKEKFNYIYKTNEVTRSKNKQIFYVIEVINKAISENKKISFNYNAYSYNVDLKPRKLEKYVVNPYFTINNKAKYFLVANTDKYDNISNYRIDYITNIEIINEPRKPMSKIVKQEQIYDPIVYANQNVYMMQGNSVQVEIKLNNEKAVSDLIDWFGDKIEFKKVNSNIHAKLIVNENTIIYWALQYGEHVEILSPKSVRNKIINIINILKCKYDP